MAETKCRRECVACCSWVMSALVLCLIRGAKMHHIVNHSLASFFLLSCGCRRRCRRRCRIADLLACSCLHSRSPLSYGRVRRGSRQYLFPSMDTRLKGLLLDYLVRIIDLHTCTRAQKTCLCSLLRARSTFPSCGSRRTNHGAYPKFGTIAVYNVVAQTLYTAQ